MLFKKTDARRKNAVINRLDYYKGNLHGQDNQESRQKIQNTVAVIRSSDEFLSRKKKQSIDSILSELESVKNASSAFVERVCDTVVKILNNTYTEPTKVEKALNILDANIDKYSATLSANEKRIRELQSKQASVLLTDKTQWKIYEAEVMKLNSQNRVLSNAFETLLKKKQTISIADTVEQAKEVNEVLNNEALDLNLDKIYDDIEDNQQVALDTNKESEDLQNKIFDSTLNNLDARYEEALKQAAEKSLKEETEEPKDPEDPING